MSIAASMRTKLNATLSPEMLEIIDQSHLHAGHAGHDGRGESHFAITIVSQAFAGKNRVQRQRLVYSILAAELKDRVHALSLKTLTQEDLGSGNEKQGHEL